MEPQGNVSSGPALSERPQVCREALVQGHGQQTGYRIVVLVKLQSDYLFIFLVERFFHVPHGSKGWRICSSYWQCYNELVLFQ